MNRWLEQRHTTMLWLAPLLWGLHSVMIQSWPTTSIQGHPLPRSNQQSFSNFKRSYRLARGTSVTQLWLLCWWFLKVYGSGIWEHDDYLLPFCPAPMHRQIWHDTDTWKYFWTIQFKGPWGSMPNPSLPLTFSPSRNIQRSLSLTHHHLQTESPMAMVGVQDSTAE